MITLMPGGDLRAAIARGPRPAPELPHEPPPETPSLPGELPVAPPEIEPWIPETPGAPPPEMPEPAERRGARACARRAGFAP